MKTHKLDRMNQEIKINTFETNNMGSNKIITKNWKWAN